MTLSCTGTINIITAPPPTQECYKGYIIYYPGNIPTITEWTGQDYQSSYAIYLDNGIPGYYGTFYWRARYVLQDLRALIDSYVLQGMPSGVQC